MAPNEDLSSNTIPKYLVYPTMLFVILRLVLFGFESRMPQSVHADSRTSAVAWTDLNSRFTKNSKSRKNKEENLLSSVTELGSEEPTKKLLLLAFLSPDSDPCKRMEENALSNSQVLNVVNKSYCPMKVTYKKNSPEKNLALTRALMEFRRHYRVCAFPTLVVVDKRGELVSNLVGNCSSLTTYRFLTRTLASH